MLTYEETQAVIDLIMVAGQVVEDGGGCRHDEGVCYCDVEVSIANGYRVLHASGVSGLNMAPSWVEHNWVTDYRFLEDGTLQPFQRCEKCLVDRAPAEADKAQAKKKRFW